MFAVLGYCPSMSQNDDPPKVTKPDMFLRLDGDHDHHPFTDVDVSVPYISFVPGTIREENKGKWRCLRPDVIQQWKPPAAAPYRFTGWAVWRGDGTLRHRLGQLGARKEDWDALSCSERHEIMASLQAVFELERAIVASVRAHPPAVRDSARGLLRKVRRMVSTEQARVRGFRADLQRERLLRDAKGAVEVVAGLIRGAIAENKRTRRNLLGDSKFLDGLAAAIDDKLRSKGWRPDHTRTALEDLLKPGATALIVARTVFLSLRIENLTEDDLKRTSVRNRRQPVGKSKGSRPRTKE